MYPYIDDIFHAQASASQTARTRDISLCSHFRLGFVINLKKSALVPSQVMLHLGALIDTARGLVFPSPARTESIVHATRALLDLTISALPISGLCSTPSSGRGVTGILPCCSSPLHVPSSSFVNSPERSVRHEGRSHFEADPFVVSSDLVSSGILVTPRSSVSGRPSLTPPSLSRPHDGRVHLWMGSGLRSSDGKGGLVERSVFSPYKLSRAGDCFPRLEEIPEVAVWRTRPSSGGQHYGDALSEQGGRDQVQELGPEGQGDYSLVSEHEDHIVGSTYIGPGQYGGGSPLSVSDRESSPLGALHRMVSRPGGNQPTLRYLGPTYSRSVRRSAEQQVFDM